MIFDRLRRCLSPLSVPEKTFNAEGYTTAVKARAGRAYRKSIKKMPHGSPRIKHIRNSDYLYLARRDGAKVVYDYIGAADSEDAKKILEQVEQRRRYEGLLKDIHHNLKDVKKVLRGKV